LSYGALLEKQEDCIFLEGKSQEMGLVGVYFRMFQSFPGATPVQLSGKSFKLSSIKPKIT